MLFIFTGNGKGKTTSALGQALRAVGDGKRVLMVQFIKGPWKSGEDASAPLLAPAFKIVKTGKGFVGILGDSLPREDHIHAAQEGLSYAHREASSGAWDIIILDEIWNALALGLVGTADIQGFIDTHRTKLELLIMTGRDCPQSFMDIADLVTEMREVKHPYNDGVKAKKGVEF